MKAFKRFYVWGMNAKFFMGIYFTAFVFFSGIVTAIYGGTTLELMTLLQMLLASVVIGFSQAFILPDGIDYSKGILFTRSVCWLVLAGAVTVLCAVTCGWFAGLPGWCPLLLGVLMVAGCACMLIGMKLEQDADTVRLNEALQAYQAPSER